MGVECHVMVGTSLVDMYAECGGIFGSRKVFDNMPERNVGYCGVAAKLLFDRVLLEMRNVVTWTVMVDGYASNGEMEAAKEVFEVMPMRNFFVWSSMVFWYCKRGDVEGLEAAKAVSIEFQSGIW
ncbi:pentatricopeptide repeat (PPR-like) superfamily protein [Actinidia rufa]|uniref:Pentatricopeptide repeat (PPR-like) superfamily protein n=1 Tax=Actinidia rufa TaxID=165716 RepID=A0A7J0FCX4_9ERIC|nr:pentatricopeptide repeat (PPR-like) superfamily protein [Actinidia rufa]